jgi:DNA (cytosine-5)-methyltransferase 1
MPGYVPVVDLFAGPGGLSEGFSAPDPSGRLSPFRVALSIEMDPIAHQTLELRAFFRQFNGDVPAEYYRHVRGELSREELFDVPHLRRQATAAKREAWNAELGLEPHASVADRVRSAIGKRASVLIGGPPCQAYSLVGRARNRGNPDYDPRSDHRHTLYLEYLRVISCQWPMVFVMENVKGLLSAKLDNKPIFPRIIEDLCDPRRALTGASRRRSNSELYEIVALTVDGNTVRTSAVDDASLRRFVVRCENHGVPQSRHRVFLIGLRKDLNLTGKAKGLGHIPQVSACRVLTGLPQIRSALSTGDSLEAWREMITGVRNEGWFRELHASDRILSDALEAAVNAAARTHRNTGDEFIRGKFAPDAHREWYADVRIGGVLNHSSRGHMAEDIKRYLFASACASVHGGSPRLADFPQALLPKHRNVKEGVAGKKFGDRFRVQVKGKPSSTVTSHISKDGHYFIHFDPSQARSLTVREAARLQTFPDNYFFCGSRTPQFHQVGNAVPPLIARQIAGVVAAMLD